MIEFKTSYSWGVSGALYLQPALVEVISDLRIILVSKTYFKNVERMVLYCRETVNRVRLGTKQH